MEPVALLISRRRTARCLHPSSPLSRTSDWKFPEGVSYLAWYGIRHGICPMGYGIRPMGYGIRLMGYGIPYTTEYITPPSGGFPTSIAQQPRGCQYRTVRLRKALGVIFPTPAFLDNDTILAVEISTTEKPTQGVVIYAVVCGVSHGTSLHRVH